MTAATIITMIATTIITITAILSTIVTLETEEAAVIPEAAVPKVVQEAVVALEALARTILQIISTQVRCPQK